MSVSELILRFCLGGALVSLFSVIGQSFEPKTFGGLFGAAPSIAIASIVIAHFKHGTHYTEADGRSMVVGAVAFAAYGIACVFLTKREHVHVTVAAVLSWLVWAAIAAAGVLILRATFT